MAVFTYLHQWLLEKKFEKKFEKKRKDGPWSKKLPGKFKKKKKKKKKKHQNFLMDLLTLLLDMFHCSERSLRFPLDRLGLGLGLGD